MTPGQIWQGFKAFYLQHPTVVAYMLQNTEYEVWPYLKWYWRTQNFATVMRRREFHPTRRARLVRSLLVIGMAMQAILGVSMIATGLLHRSHIEFAFFGAAVVISYPVIWAHLIVAPLLAVKWFIVAPKNRRLVAGSKKAFHDHPAVKVAVAGSYGKTTMKEILQTVIAEGKKVAATPGNMNVAVSHARFVKSLNGDEEVLIIEYGEGAPGDVKRFADTTGPDYAVITGLAPAHLDKYKTLDAAAKDIFSLKEVVSAEHIYVNTQSPNIESYIEPDFQKYSSSGVGAWKIQDVSVTAEGTKFTLTDSNTSLKLHSKILGEHQVGPLAAAAVLALELGLTPEHVTRGIAKTEPFAHRMQPYQLHGAWIIDDTYNGNLEGIRAGTTLLQKLDAERKWYVTPGLVDQGKETERVHIEVGRLMAEARPDIVVLMRNSVTAHIQKGLEDGGFSGEVRLEEDPLAFYTNLEHFITRGDLVLMQNDWTDNYA